MLRPYYSEYIILPNFFHNCAPILSVPTAPICAMAFEITQ